LGSAHNIFQYNNLSGANSDAVCVLKLSLKKQATAIKKTYILLTNNDFLFLLLSLFKANTVVFKPQNSKLFCYH